MRNLKQASRLRFLWFSVFIGLGSLIFAGSARALDSIFVEIDTNLHEANRHATYYPPGEYYEFRGDYAFYYLRADGTLSYSSGQTNYNFMTIITTYASTPNDLRVISALQAVQGRPYITTALNVTDPLGGNYPGFSARLVAQDASKKYWEVAAPGTGGFPSLTTAWTQVKAIYDLYKKTGSVSGTISTLFNNWWNSQFSGLLGSDQSNFGTQAPTYGFPANSARAKNLSNMFSSGGKSVPSGLPAAGNFTGNTSVSTIDDPVKSNNLPPGLPAAAEDVRTGGRTIFDADIGPGTNPSAVITTGDGVPEVINPPTGMQASLDVLRGASIPVKAVRFGPGANQWVILWAQNGFAQSGLPQALVDALTSLQSQGREIREVIFKKSDASGNTWMVLYDVNGFVQANMPASLVTRLQSMQASKYKIVSVYVHTDNSWVVVGGPRNMQSASYSTSPAPPSFITQAVAAYSATNTDRVRVTGNSSGGLFFYGSQAPVLAALTSPQENWQVQGLTTFAWTDGYKVDGYALWIGSTPGGYDIYAGSEGKNTQRDVTLPSDGRPIYVRLWSMIGGKWERYYSYTITTGRATAATMKAQMQSPAIGTSLTSQNATFTWDAGAGNDGYYLWVGSAPGTYDLYAGDEGTNLTRTVSLPQDGRTIYVRLWTKFAGQALQFNDYIYTTQFIQPGAAKITSPASPGTLPQGSATFTWDAGARADQYALWVGSEPGTYDLYAGGEGRNQTKTLNVIPSDGRPVYVRLWTMIAGKWERFNDYIFNTSVAPGPVKARLTSPTNNSLLSSVFPTFTWTASAGAEGYALWVGSTPGTYDLYAADEGTATSDLIYLPGDGRPIYVRLWTKIGGKWEKFNDYTFATPNSDSGMAFLKSPLSGSKLALPTTTFTWDPVPGAQMYALWIGSTFGAMDLYAAGEGLNTSRAVTLPTDGRELFVKLWTMVDGVWVNSNAVFRAYSLPSQTKAQLTSPSGGATLTGASTTLSWNSGTGAQQYALWIGSTPGAYDLYAGGEGTNLSKTVTLPTDGRPVYVRLWTMFNGAWVQFNNYWFTTQAGSGPAKAQMTSPANGSTFSSTAVTFTWNAGSQAQQYALWVGSAPGAYDIYAGGEALRTSKALTIPATGKPVYVRLWTMLNGAWTDYNTYVYTAKGP